MPARNDPAAVRWNRDLALAAATVALLRYAGYEANTGVVARMLASHGVERKHVRRVLAALVETGLVEEDPDEDRVHPSRPPAAQRTRTWWWLPEPALLQRGAVKSRPPWALSEYVGLPFSLADAASALGVRSEHEARTVLSGLIKNGTVELGPDRLYRLHARSEWADVGWPALLRSLGELNEKEEKSGG